MALSIREADAKRLLWTRLSDPTPATGATPQTAHVPAYNGFASSDAAHVDESCSLLRGVCVAVDSTTDLEDLPSAHPWLLTSRLTVKPDVLLKRRGKSGLVKLDLSWADAQKELKALMGTQFTMQGLTGTLDHFIVEPFFPHDVAANEFYVAIRTLREGDEILFSHRGGVDVGNVDEHARRVLIPIESQAKNDAEPISAMTNGCVPAAVPAAAAPCSTSLSAGDAMKGNVNGSTQPKTLEEISKRGSECRLTQEELVSLVAPLVTDVAGNEAKKALPVFLAELYRQFCEMHFAFLEINPFCFDAATHAFAILDCAAKLDHTAEFLCDKKWGHICFPSPFGRRFTEEERYIRELDSKTGASLKLTVLNPKGRIWTLIAGGGASVVYADTVCDLGFGDELCNYGEYSGAPSEITTYEYTKTILGLMTAPGSYREEGKVLLIGGGIANFTNVADTFRGIIRALRDFREQLREFKVRIYVRRGGPNYQEGLKRMREVGEELNIHVKVFGPETYMTSIIPFALQDEEGVDASKSESEKEGEEPVAATASGFAATPATMNDMIGDFAQHHGWDLSLSSDVFASAGRATSPLPDSTSAGIVPVTPSSRESRGTFVHGGRLSPWHEMTMEEVEKNPHFEKYIQAFLAQQKATDTPPAGEASHSTVTASGDAGTGNALASLLTDSHESQLFTQTTNCFVWGLQTRAVQEMLDFDHACGRKKPSVAAILYEFSVSHQRSFYFGTEEVLLPVYQTLQEAVHHFPEVSVLINFASMRSAASVTRLALETAPQLRTIVVIAEGVPEREARQLAAETRARGVCLIGPATVGGITSGAFRIGNTGGTLENVMNARLYRPGSVGCVTKSGGMLNEMNNILSIVSDGTYEAIAIGGDRFPGTSMLDHLLRFERNPDIKFLVLLGEVGGGMEYEVVEAIKDGRLTKPLIAWCVGTCASLFSTEVSFGHAGAWAGSHREHAAAKNAALKAAGAFVPSSFDELGKAIRHVYVQLVKQGVVVPRKEVPVPRIPMDYAWAKKLGLVRKPKGFISTISDDRGEELLYAGWPISKVLGDQLGVGGVISLLWFKRPLPEYCYRYLERVLMLTADHGPAVCGAHNVIVTARAGKDLISSLISGLCTIGDRFGGACDQAAQQFLGAFTSRMAPAEFVAEMKKQNKLVMGIGHRIKSVHNPDMRVQLLKTFCKSNFPQTPLIDYAEQVEQVTTKKKDTLILNVDGLIGVSMCDMLFHCGHFTENEARDYIHNGCINGLFVLGRSIGFIGHFLDQKRLKQGLYRHDVDDIAYVLPDWSSSENKDK
ncbi:cDNA FLJ55447, highly similar to ATP-citrate synthase, related [Neospora caninum Liverpool]|uniref:ATP citrate synthase n=1 Tax=Neospora caninum (strain Liverpool) TaxID=572307 RepID=F0VK37_NEOCL|nr:cDNA FLJ55447, highly similar to ATP-citrate synthase, related [Neospora caninum Liverpool]CBZ54438.1 cDNA FLJ55447, highly similar to ATP-citrate synthase, related [Neospora caninum Liverpool]CEL69147.1 TPA: ATP-citrate synthase, related [Neospora caninum Liverpool]|eukprot:XP_003884468.1 cDNA FLJ55447, highly similar to ATP-citrate synthase, related [Neospora caninum Liverpool]